MNEVQSASSNAVRETLKKICQDKGRNIFEAEDFMDDGSRIKLKITIDPETGNADFDFNGTSPQANGKTKFPISAEKMRFTDYTKPTRKLECSHSCLQLCYYLYTTLPRECGYSVKSRMHSSSELDYSGEFIP